MYWVGGSATVMQWGRQSGFSHLFVGLKHIKNSLLKNRPQCSRGGGLKLSCPVLASHFYIVVWCNGNQNS